MKRHVSVIILLMVCFVTSVSSQVPKKAATYAILLDNTGSLRHQLGISKDIAKEIVRTTINRASISIFQFQPNQKDYTSVFTIGIEESDDVNALNKHLDQIVTVPGQTSLFDAIKLSSERVSKNTATTEKALIIISDGDDRFSKTKSDELMTFVKGTGIKVLVVGLINDPPNVTLTKGARAEKRENKKFLLGITEGTLGRVVFPAEKEAVEEIVKQLLAPVVPK
jgi:hypothetical protein